MAVEKDGMLDLEKELSCSICTEVLYQPLTLLDCLHTFCGSCLKEWFAWQATNATSPHPYTCPACRASVRGTKPNATVTTLLDMFLAARPDRGKTVEDKQEMQKSYKPGDDVIPPINKHLDTEDSEDERVLAEAHELSLQDPDAHRSARRTTANNHGRTSRHSQGNSPRDRHAASRIEQHLPFQQTPGVFAQGRRLEHQSSLRSLLSASDLDSEGMEEEIMRQIIDDGLLDGVDLNSLTPIQEEEITERIAHAVRRRQRQRSRQLQDTQRSDQSHASIRNAAPRRTPRVSLASQTVLHAAAHPPTSQPHLFESASHSSTRRHHRRTSSELSQGSENSVTRSTGVHGVASTAQTAGGLAVGLSQQLTEDRHDRPRRQSRRRTADSQPQAENTGSYQESSAALGLSSPSRDRNVPVPTELYPPDPIDRSTNPLLALRSRDRPTNNSSPSLTAIPNLFRVSDDSRRARSSSATDAERTSAHDQTLSSRIDRVSCSRCEKPGIERSLHYNCSTCLGGGFNLCLHCYRNGKGCLHWFGFGYAAGRSFEKAVATKTVEEGSERPHVLSARRYTADSGTLQEGLFCEGCFEHANSCYWHCDTCNDGAWGFCNVCTQKGKHCLHYLGSVGHVDWVKTSAQMSNLGQNAYPATTTTLSEPAAHLPNVPDSSQYLPLVTTTHCAICHSSIPPSNTRFHCHVCDDGNHDVCTSCYHQLIASGQISAEDGPQGWRRCLQGHRMSIIGFEDREGGPKRVVVREMVGGWALKEEDQSSTTARGPRDPVDQRDRRIEDASATKQFPPDGGVGMRTQALWSYFRDMDAKDELNFPKHAIVTEVQDANGDWFWGVYAGKVGLFPANYVRELRSQAW